MVADEYLFEKLDWFSVEQTQTNALKSEISLMDGDRLLNTSVEDLCDYLLNKYKFEVPLLYENKIVVDQNEVNIDVSHDSSRDIRNRSRPFYIKGTEIEVTIPFDGFPEIFKINPNYFSSNPPRAMVRNQKIILKISGTDLSKDDVKNSISSTISNIKGYLSNLQSKFSEWNSKIPQLSKQQIEQRRKKLLADKNLLNSLGFALKVRPGSEKTYQAPNVRKRIRPSPPQASGDSYKPEPELSINDYNYILKVIENMAEVMERSPSAFTSINEEALRTHFLVQLNGHYEGQATGETFNFEGKTDILIRSNGKNIFIGECKFWNGPKKLLDTIDQILNYSSWRDTKVAIIIFSRIKEFSKVLEAIPKAVLKHKHFKREIGQISETHYKYIFSHRDDSNREIHLSILVFNVPNKNEA